MCFFMAACGGEKSGAEKMEALIEDLQQNGKGWNAEQWETFLTDMYKTQIEVVKGIQDENGYKEYVALGEKVEAALNSIEAEADETALSTAFMKLMTNEEFMKGIEEAENLEAELEAKYAPKEAEAEEEEVSDSLEVEEPAGDDVE
jgi:hypothetical protein